jgi:hypothetical protein
MMAVSNKTLFDLLAELHGKSSNMLDFWNSAGNFYELILGFSCRRGLQIAISIKQCGFTL